jgi:hypothetical protein
MSVNQTKYGVQNRLASLENAVTELKKENAELRTHLLTELKNAVSDTVGQTGATGRDGASITGPAGPAGKDSNVQGPRGAEGRRGDTGPRGERGETGEQGIQGLTGATGAQGPVGATGPAGDITVYGDAELQAAVVQLRTELIQQRARFLAAHFQALAEAKGPHERIWRQRLETLKRDAGL